MPTEVLRVDPSSPEPHVIARAAQLLQSGGLVAFPTETVYGIGANALNPAAVAGIFAAKERRPAQNPIIVHVAEAVDAQKLVTDWPRSAQMLAERFWPGPLTLVLPKHPAVPDVVTAGGPTVAIRIPAHAVALALLRACGLPIAAPSANRSTELSPTLPGHVLRSLADRINLLLDAGPATGGLESTVLDLTTQPPRLLRPGLVTITELEAVVGRIDRPTGKPNDAEPVRSPGQMERHYAPRTPLEVVEQSRSRVEELCRQGLLIGWLTHQASDTLKLPAVGILLPADFVSYSAQLYAALHRLDKAGLDRIIVEKPPVGEDWLAVHDRLRRASVR